MAVDRKARTDLRNALAQYMTGKTHTFAFDDANCECTKSRDTSVKEISHFLYNLHDDFVDHPISVTSERWGALQRILAFLDTDLAITTIPKLPTWPFHNHEEWHANEHRIKDIGLPQYDPAIHARQIHPRWNRIPSSIGFAVLAVLVIGIIVAVSLS